MAVNRAQCRCVDLVEWYTSGSFCVRCQELFPETDDAVGCSSSRRTVIHPFITAVLTQLCYLISTEKWKDFCCRWTCMSGFETFVLIAGLSYWPLLSTTFKHCQRICFKVSERALKGWDRRLVILRQLNAFLVKESTFNHFRFSCSWNWTGCPLFSCFILVRYQCKRPHKTTTAVEWSRIQLACSKSQRKPVLRVP